MNGQQLADIGIEAARQHAEAFTLNWTEQVLACLEDWAPRQREPFAFEDFRFYINTHHDDLMPPTSKAWGSISRLGVSRGILRPTGEFRPARSPGTHGHPVRVFVGGRR